MSGFLKHFSHILGALLTSVPFCFAQDLTGVFPGTSNTSTTESLVFEQEENSQGVRSLRDIYDTARANYKKGKAAQVHLKEMDRQAICPSCSDAGNRIPELTHQVSRILENLNQTSPDKIVQDEKEKVDLGYQLVQLEQVLFLQKSQKSFCPQNDEYTGPEFITEGIRASTLEMVFSEPVDPELLDSIKIKKMDGTTHFFRTTKDGKPYLVRVDVPLDTPDRPAEKALLRLYAIEQQRKPEKVKVNRMIFGTTVSSALASAEKPEIEPLMLENSIGRWSYNAAAGLSVTQKIDGIGEYTTPTDATLMDATMRYDGPGAISGLLNTNLTARRGFQVSGAVTNSRTGRPILGVGMKHLAPELDLHYSVSLRNTGASRYRAVGILALTPEEAETTFNIQKETAEKLRTLAIIRATSHYSGKSSEIAASKQWNNTGAEVYVRTDDGTGQTAMVNFIYTFR